VKRDPKPPRNSFTPIDPQTFRRTPPKAPKTPAQGKKNPGKGKGEQKAIKGKRVIVGDPKKPKGVEHFKRAWRPHHCVKTVVVPVRPKFKTKMCPRKWKKEFGMALG